MESLGEQADVETLLYQQETQQSIDIEPPQMDEAATAAMSDAISTLASFSSSAQHQLQHGDSVLAESQAENSTSLDQLDTLSAGAPLDVTGQLEQDEAIVTGSSSGALSEFSARQQAGSPLSGRSSSRHKQLHICHICSRGCPSKHKLKRHLCTHSEDRPFNCCVCNKSFKWTEYLQKHMRQQHPGTAELVVAVSSMTNGTSTTAASPNHPPPSSPLLLLTPSTDPPPPPLSPPTAVTEAAIAVGMEKITQNSCSPSSMESLSQEDSGGQDTVKSEPTTIALCQSASLLHHTDIDILQHGSQLSLDSSDASILHESSQTSAGIVLQDLSSTSSSSRLASVEQCSVGVEVDMDSSGAEVERGMETTVCQSTLDSLAKQESQHGFSNGLQQQQQQQCVSNASIMTSMQQSTYNSQGLTLQTVSAAPSHSMQTSQDLNSMSADLQSSMPLSNSLSLLPPELISLASQTSVTSEPIAMSSQVLPQYNFSIPNQSQQMSILSLYGRDSGNGTVSQDYGMGTGNTITTQSYDMNVVNAGTHDYGMGTGNGTVPQDFTIASQEYGMGTGSQQDYGMGTANVVQTPQDFGMSTGSGTYSQDYGGNGTQDFGIGTGNSLDYASDNTMSLMQQLPASSALNFTQTFQMMQQTGTHQQQQQHSHSYQQPNQPAYMEISTSGIFDNNQHLIPQQQQQQQVFQPPPQPLTQQAEVVTVNNFTTGQPLAYQQQQAMLPLKEEEDKSDARPCLKSIEFGIQCELGPETLVALKEEEAEAAALALAQQEQKQKQQKQNSDEVTSSSGNLAPSSISSISASVPLTSDSRKTCNGQLNDSHKDDRIIQKFPCEVVECSKAYVHRKDLIRHMKIRHGISPKKLEPVIVETPEKPYNCLVGHCGRSYFHMKDLRRHQRQCHTVNSGSSSPGMVAEEICDEDGRIQMRYPCDFGGCLRSYVHKKDLVRHKRLFHKDPTNKPTVPIPIRYSETDLRKIRQEVKMEIDKTVEKIRLDSTGSAGSAATSNGEDTPNSSNILLDAGADLASLSASEILANFSANASMSSMLLDSSIASSLCTTQDALTTAACSLSGTEAMKPMFTEENRDSENPASLLSNSSSDDHSSVEKLPQFSIKLSSSSGTITPTIIAYCNSSAGSNDVTTSSSNASNAGSSTPGSNGTVYSFAVITDQVGTESANSAITPQQSMEISRQIAQILQHCQHETPLQKESDSPMANAIP